MMMKPLVTAIIPVYNGARFISESIESIIAQTYRPVEIIVVDDGSSDETAQIVQSYKGIRYIFQPNHGVASARNTGIGKSRGELIAFLDADDCWAPDKLTVQVNYLDDNPHVGCVLGRQRNFLEPGIDRPFWLREEHLLRDHVGVLPTSLIRRNIFDMIGLFDTEYKISEDVEWLARVKDAGLPVIVVPVIVLHRRIHDSNLSYQLRAGDPTLLRSLRASVQRKRTKTSEDGTA